MPFTAPRVRTHSAAVPVLLLYILPARRPARSATGLTAPDAAPSASPKRSVAARCFVRSTGHLALGLGAVPRLPTEVLPCGTGKLARPPPRASPFVRELAHSISSRARVEPGAQVRQPFYMELACREMTLRLRRKMHLEK